MRARDVIKTALETRKPGESNSSLATVVAAALRARGLLASRQPAAPESSAPPSYLVQMGGRWRICRPGAAQDSTEPCADCDGAGVVPTSRNRRITVTCSGCDGTGRQETDRSRLRLAWYAVGPAGEDAGLVAYDWQEPDVRRLPDDDL